MKRFYHERSYSAIKSVLSVLVFLAAFWAFSHMYSDVSSKTAETGAVTLEQALLKGIVHCYASEGRYPESLSYLMEHYPVYYDEELYFVDYQVLGENIFPDVTIIQKQEP